MKLIGALNKQLTEKPYLYRIELLDRFYKILDQKELVFVRPSRWTDPLENIIFNARLIKDGKPFEHPAKTNIYAQCWSYEGDSYALWQVYTTKPDDANVFKRHYGVRIVTHIDKLIQISNLNKGQYYYGMVNYLWKKDLSTLRKNEEFKKGLKYVELNEDHLKTLLVKRRSYKYENELRLLAVPEKQHVDPTDDTLCRLKIEPVDFISSVRLDPAMPHSEFKKIKEQLVDQYQFRPTQITQSTMMKRNRFVFNLDK